MRYILFILVTLLSASTMQQSTVVFTEPVDALSIGFTSKNDVVHVRTGNEWTALHVEDEADPNLLESNLVIFPAPTTKIVFKGKVDQFDLHPITVSKEPSSYEVASLNTIGKPRILARHQWGADDTFLYSAPSSSSSSTATTTTTSSAGSSTSGRVEECNNAQVNYPGDFSVSRTVTHDASGNQLRWARRYSPDVKVLVVHHTAQRVAGDTRPPVERMRALYAFHANNRAWGDIGYHYIIDEQGTIYEGRSGGKNVVGGHVYCNNVGTVGVSLMGNFDEEQPTQAQVHSLQWLLQDLGEQYDISLERNAYFHGKNTKTIVGHKDLISTECPGYYMDAAMAQVRRNVIAGDIDANVIFPTIAKETTHTDRTESRLAARLEQAGEALSRRFYRAKRLVRTASRQTNDARMQMIEQQRSAGVNVQRQRAAEDARRKRIADAQGVTTRRTITTSVTNVEPTDDIRIRLSYSSNTAEVSLGSRTIRLGREGSSCTAVENGRVTSEGIVRIDAGTSVFEIGSWNTQWNRFRGTLECRVIDGSLVLINELPLEDYMAGLSEQPDTEPYEKQRAFAIAARSYAAFYMVDGNEKFAGMPYHGSDTGASFQNYSGVTSEQHNPRWVQAVQSTAGIVVTKNSQIVKTAYYSSNDGRTRSPEENGWRNFPFAEVFSSKPDPWCEGMRLHGHGVGMSGCGAEAQAEEGKSAEAILKYYYPGTTLQQLSLLQ